MDLTEEAVGGDLLYLWTTANVEFPKIQNVYNEQLKTIAPVAGSPDDKKFGKCHPWWDMLSQELERALVKSVDSLEQSSEALNNALTEFTHIDGDTGKKLNKSGEQLNELLDRKDITGVDVKPMPDDYEAPSDNFRKPDSWSEGRDV